MAATKVGIREFRENLAMYLEAKGPVAVTRHGTTIGIFTPTRPRATKEQLEALRVAGEEIDAMITAAGTNVEELVADFDLIRKQSRQLKS